MSDCRSRRWMLAGTGALGLVAAGPARAGRDVSGDLAALERKLGGRLGLAALDLNDGTRLAYRAEERFPFLRIAAFLAAAFALARCDRGDEDPERRIVFDEAALVANSPVTRPRVHGSGMSIAELAEAALASGDWSATNLLYGTFGGPSGLEQFLRERGDETTRVDRLEPDLAEGKPGDPRDTTSPAVMLEHMERILTENALKPASRERLIAWLVADRSGSGRLRAGVPRTWQVAERGATGLNGASSGIALAWPPGRSPVLIAAFTAGSKGSVLQLNEAFAAIGRTVAAGFA